MIYTSFFHFLWTTVDSIENPPETFPFESFIVHDRQLLSQANELQNRARTANSTLGRHYLRENNEVRSRKIDWTCLEPGSLINPKLEYSPREIVFRDGRRHEFIIQNNTLISQRRVVPPQAITAKLRYCPSIFWHMPFPSTQFASIFSRFV